MRSVEGYALYALDSTGRVIGRNPAAQKCEGYSQEEIIGEHHSILFTPEDIEARIPDTELRLAERTGRYAGETSLIKKDGEPFWASFQVTVVRDPEGKLLGFAKVVQDITQRKYRNDALRRAEALTRRERDRIAAVLDTIMDGCCICEPVRDKRGQIEDFAFTYVNRSFTYQLGMSPESLLRGRISYLLPWLCDDTLLDRLREVVTTGEALMTDVEIGQKAGLAGKLRLRAVRVDDGIVLTLSPITTSSHQRPSSALKFDPAVRNGSYPSEQGAD